MVMLLVDTAEMLFVLFQRFPNPTLCCVRLFGVWFLKPKEIVNSTGTSIGRHGYQRLQLPLS